ncbi:MAG TPA: Ig-like domain-containing protein, partial [Micropruina sp.]|nr:Ig-like domain-containing protein [Micropruina sp.]
MQLSVDSLRYAPGPGHAPVWLRALLALVLVTAWTASATPAAHADGPTTFSNTTSIAIPATGSADQRGPAGPYPSGIAVSGMTGTVSKVTVTFHGLTHSTANDVDALVVAPNGANLVVMSDIGDPNQLAVASNATLTFDDAAGSGLSPGNIPTGTYKPTNVSALATDGWPAPAPTPSNQTTLAGAFTGLADANGTWQLFIVDDSSGDVGVMTGGWSVTLTTEAAASATSTTVTSSDTTSTTGDPVTFTATVSAGASPVTAGTVQFASDGVNLGAPVPLNGSGRASLTTSTLTQGTHLIRATFGGATGFLTSNGSVSQRVDNATTVTGRTFCNTGAISGPQQGTSTPWPSNVFVSGLGGNVTKVTASLKGLSHTAPIDFDILLSGPTPADNVLLLSDGGGQNAVSNLNLNFDDAAATTVPAPAVSGTYKPTRVADESTESLPAPAPPLSSATTLSTFNGKAANGTWSLWVFDDATGDTGSIANGWCVTIQTAAPTTTVLTASPNPADHGDPVTLTATVASVGSPVPSGTVQFSDGATVLGSVPVEATGKATFTTSTFTNGTHPITATYQANDDYGTSTGTLNVVVAARATNTALTATPNPASHGENVTLTATVTSSGSPVTTGTVLFSDGAVVLGGVPVDASGVASYSTSSLTNGTHPITATFEAGDDYTASTGTLNVVVAAKATTTTLTATPNPVQVGDPVTLTATVSTDGATVTTGTVQFSDGATSLGSVPVDASGAAVLTTSTLAVGTHAITASYTDGDDLGPSSDAIDVVVEQLPATSLQLSADPNPGYLGFLVTLTATLTFNGSPVTSGTVVFTSGATTLGSVPVDVQGHARLITNTLPLGTTNVRAEFAATPDLLGSSDSLDVVIQPVAFDAGGPYTVAEGESLTLAGTGSAVPGISYSWDLNDDGDFGDATGLAPSITWTQLEALGIDDGLSSHQLRMRAVAGGVNQVVTADLTVTNTAPAAVVTGALTATVGTPFTVKVFADDPSSADLAAQFDYTVDWGDGAPVVTVSGPTDTSVTHT